MTQADSWKHAAQPRRFIRRPSLWGFLLTLPTLVRAASAPDQGGVEFFEKHVRPVLIENCYKCHSAEAEKIKGGLLLDTREGVLKGGDTGPAIVPGQPEKSLLIKAIRYTDENLQMPPKGKKLEPEQIADLEAWVKMGAPDPRTAKVKSQAAKTSGSPHWAFQAVKEPPTPAVKNKALVHNSVDNFILAKLEEKKIKPNALANKQTLLRRATFDLLGLPPSADEVAQFMADKSRDAFAKAVERLLASPRYGERWGRYWLDIARYADTKGYVFEEERRYPYSYTYRDWVIRAFNEDLPYDQFLRQQIAADLLPLGDDKRPLAALGFLTLGRRFLNNISDIIDDRIDVVCRGTMGLTVACARCHDHKFDPIPTRDYYSLYGVFASCNEPADKPLLGIAPNTYDYADYLAEKKKREVEWNNFRATKENEVLTKVRGQVGDYLLVLHDVAQSDDDKRENLVRQRKLEPNLVRHYRRTINEWTNSTNTIFAPWFAFAAVPETNFVERSKDLTAQFSTDGAASNRINPFVAKIFSGEAPGSLKEVAERYNKLFASVDQEWKAAESNSPPSKALADPHREALRQVLYGSDSPIIALDDGEIRRLLDTPAQQKLRALRRKIDETDATHPGAPPRAMALLDNNSPTRPRVFKRGNPNNTGEEVPRQFLEIVAGPERKPFGKGSGRLELAQAIADKSNPLTARVFVNRVWMYHFGASLVRTPSDFGTRADPPTHPELLDFLAFRFAADGWSMKSLHRLMMLSRCYQQSSDDNPSADKIDPSNQLLWKMNRRRLDFEAMRDTLLTVAGQIDFTAGGRAVDLTTEPFTSRRTIYGFVERQNLPGLFRTFDFASPDTTSSQRFATTVPQQALFLMNSPFVVQQAKRLIARPEVQAQPSETAKLQKLYQAAYQRAPDAEEIKLAVAFIHAASAAPEPVFEPPVWEYGYGAFDESAKRVKAFSYLPHFNGYAWQGGTNLPDAKLGWVILNAEGGHVGNDLNHAAIRRWHAPRDGVVRIAGELNHPSEKGDGVRARIVSSRLGELGQWTAQHQAVPVILERVEVQAGDIIDFVTDCRASVEFDTFHWAPTIRFKGRATDSGPRRDWDAKADFAGPPKEKPRPTLTAWEKYAQVLLLANELVFVD